VSGGNAARAGAWATYRHRAKREAILAAVVAVCAVGAGILGLWMAATGSIREDYQHYLVGLTETAATLVDPALHNAIRRPEQRNGPDYLRAVQPLRRMQTAVPDIRYVYTVIRDGGKVRFVLDAADPADRTVDGNPDQAGVWEAYENGGSALDLALGNGREAGRASATDRLSSDKWGTFMTGWAPLLDAAGRQIGAVGIDIDARVYLARLATARNSALLGLVPAGIFIAILVVGFYRIRLRGLADAGAAIESAESAERASKVLAVERERLSAVIEDTGVGIWEWDLVTDMRTVDQRWAGIIGSRHEDLSPLANDRWQTLVHPDDLPGMQQALAACVTTPEEILVHEFRMHHADGRWIWILAHGKVMTWDEHGRPLRMAGIHLDVSPSKMIERSLQESEIKFRSLFELSPVGIALNDMRTGQFLQVNDAMVIPTGYTREELLGMTYWDITPAIFATEESAQLESMEKTDKYGPYEKLYQRKDGSTYSVLLSGIRLKDISGREVIWSIVQDISQRKAMESELAEAARRDKLTGLANRALFMERLQEAVARVNAARQPMFAVLFLDFDRFKLINDTLGHKAGDELLRQISGRLRGALRAADTIPADAFGNVVARFGGDEFLILINDLQTRADANVVATRLLEDLAPVYSIFGSEVRSTASIGIVTSEQGQATAEDVLRNADVAMYEAKRSGRACSVVFSEAMHTRLARHVAIETDLHRAIGTAELSLVFQPILELQSGKMVSAEALVRWNHPELGPISPSEFIPIAEETGLIAALGQWVLKEACQALVTWRQLDPRRAPRTISVNISRAELALGSRLLEQVVGILQSTGLPAHCLQLEVTEREVMRNPEASFELMNELRRLGVNLAMDDFGTGTSSLGFLRGYPFDIIKIDRSFVKDLNTGRDVLAVIHATINLIENLGMASLAEGVEESAQLAVLQSLGCRYAQGYLFSRPVPAEQLLDALGAPANATLLAAAS
jgi:diguanylate cyclase (GGDEF)-like protein/PAS domain S-box-containing protein